MCVNQIRYWTYTAVELTGVYCIDDKKINGGVGSKMYDVQWAGIGVLVAATDLFNPVRPVRSTNMRTPVRITSIPTATPNEAENTH